MSTAAHSFEAELNHRLGMTMSAFSSIRKTVIGNPRLRKGTRCTLVGSLLLSKLFFGCGAWPLLTAAVSRRLDSFVAKLYREALDLQFWRETGLGDDFILAKHKLLTPRVRIARDRLLYAASIAQAGPAHLWGRLLHLHQIRPEGSWVAGLESDLRWLSTILPELEQAEWNADWDKRCEFWIHSPRQWHGYVQKACTLHLAQECTLAQVKWWHGLVLKEFSAKGAIFPNDVQESALDTSFLCHCGRGFGSKRGLAVHQRHKHSKHAPEFHLASGTVCPACLREMWSTKRLRQHMAYAPRDGTPNWCFVQMKQGNVHFAQPEVQHADPQFRGINRLDSIQTQGPVGHSLTGQFALRRQLIAELFEVEEKLRGLGWKDPPDMKVWDEVCRALTAGTHSWYQDWYRDYPHGDDDELQNFWFEVFDQWQMGDELSIIFLRWSDDWTEDIFAEWGDIFAAEVVERQAVALYTTFESTPLQKKGETYS